MADHRLGIALDRAAQKLTDRMKQQTYGGSLRQFRFVFDPEADAFDVFMTVRTKERKVGRAFSQGERSVFEYVGDLGSAEHAFWCGAFAVIFSDIADYI